MTLKTKHTMETWLDTAASDVCEGAKARIRQEVTDHYQQAYRDAIATEKDALAAEAVALAALGDPNVARKQFRRMYFTTYQIELVEFLVRWRTGFRVLATVYCAVIFCGIWSKSLHLIDVSIDKFQFFVHVAYFGLGAVLACCMLFLFYTLPKAAGPHARLYALVLTPVVGSAWGTQAFLLVMLDPYGRHNPVDLTIQTVTGVFAGLSLAIGLVAAARNLILIRRNKAIRNW